MKSKFKRGVSPVIATLLLILIAVAASIIVYVWVTGYLGASTPTSTPEIMERIKIDSVKVSSTTVTIYVRNIGDITVNITSAYVIDAETGTTVASNDSVKTTIGPGEVKAVYVNVTSVTLTSGKPYVAKVVTKNGVEAATVFRWP